MELSILVKHQQSFEPYAVPTAYFAGTAYFIGRVINTNENSEIVEMKGIKIYDSSIGVCVIDSDLIAPTEDFPNFSVEDKVVAIEKRSDMGVISVINLRNN